jgi:small subunit ribosomal protein S16
MGSTNRPFFRLVAIDSRMRRDGRSVAELGFYDPLKKPAVVQLDEEPILEWLRRGAEPSDTVRELLRERGVLQKFELMQGGATAVDATQRVAARLSTRTVKEKKARLSKKARAKAAAADKGADAAASSPAGSSADA